MPARTLAPEEGGLWDPTSVGEENEASFVRVWKPLLNRHILKTLRQNPKGKLQKGPYLLAVACGLDWMGWTITILMLGSHSKSQRAKHASNLT